MEHRETAESAALTEAIAVIGAELPGRLGVFISYVPDGPSIAYHADDLFPAASVIKIPIMVEVYRQAERGMLSLDEPLPVLAEEVTDGSGLLQYLHTGLALTVRDAVELMIAISDNTATNLLVRRVGSEAINQTMRALGLEQTTQGGAIRKANDATPLPARSRTTPRETARLLEAIARGTLWSAAASLAMWQHLEHQIHNEMLPRHLPIIAYPERLGLDAMPVRVAHKTGGLSGVRHDAGIIAARTDRGERLAIVSAFTADLDDGELWTAENVGARAIARIGRLAYDALVRLPSTAASGHGAPEKE